MVVSSYSGLITSALTSFLALTFRKSLFFMTGNNNMNVFNIICIVMFKQFRVLF